jgi:hypothetical protein
MDTIGAQQLWSFVDGHEQAQRTDCTTVRKSAGRLAASYLELATLVAELQFRNNDHVLLFRGQSGDYKNAEQNTKLKPSLFRPVTTGNPNAQRLERRFAALKEAETILAREYVQAKLLGMDRLTRHRIVRWAMLQHYEVCKTPLLDVTHSLRIAASFASHDAKAEAYVFVVGVPNVSGGITASAEAGLQTVRLSSICPPSALRPHIQEGYLLGEYPDLAGLDQKGHYKHYEIDFGRRLVAKFRIQPAAFWKQGTFPLIPKEDLYPSAEIDPLYKLALRVKKALSDPDA